MFAPFCIAIFLLLPAAALADRPHERWSFAWDLHPQAAQIGYFELQIDVPGKRWIHRITGGAITTIRAVLVDPAYPGNGTAVLRACRQNGECSADSNAVTLDRTPPQPPAAVSHGQQR